MNCPRPRGVSAVPGPLYARENQKRQENSWALIPPHKSLPSSSAVQQHTSRRWAELGRPGCRCKVNSKPALNRDNCWFWGVFFVYIYLLWGFGRVEGLKGTLSICASSNFTDCRHQANANRLFPPDLFVLTLSIVPRFASGLWARRLIHLSCGGHICKVRVMMVLCLSEGFRKLNVFLLTEV